MSDFKKQPASVSGNLRDFRIQGTTTHSHEKIPSQQVRQRSTSLEEWNEHSGNGNSSDELWTTWNEDLKQNLNEAAHTISKNTVHTKNENIHPRLQQHSKAPTTSAPAADPAESSQLPWAARLAIDERQMERTGVVDFTNSYNKHELLKTRTLEFMTQLHKSFREHIEIFNESRNSSAQIMRVYRVSNTEEDFMLFRNGVKLLVSGQRAGKVIFAFSQYLGQLFAPSQTPTIELEAVWGPFDQLYWSYKGERVALLDVVRYFMTEFAKQSVR